MEASAYTKSSQELVRNVSIIDMGSTEKRNSPRSLWQAIKRSARIVAYCLALSSAILMYGYDLVIVGTVVAMPQFQIRFGQRFNEMYIIPSMWLSLWSVSSCFGLMFGSIIGSYFQERQGRRVALAVGSFLSAIAVAICYISDLPDSIDARRGVFFAGKVFQGACIGILLCVAQTYIQLMPQEVKLGGLHTVLDGVSLVRAGKVHGKKLVYPIL